MTAKETELLRIALSQLTPAPSHDAVTPPELQQIYTPEGHEAALDPDRVLVVGGRGTGKSFWSASLLNEQTRRFVAQSYPRLSLDKCRVALGFAGVDTDVNDAPSREELDDLIEVDGHRPEKVWRAVFLRAAGRFVPMGLPTSLRGSDGLVAWVDADAARVQQHLRRADEEMSSQGLRLVVLFDALDRLGRNWGQIRERTRALLLVTLALRTYRAIKPKIFLRVDQAEDAGVAAFPDASKLLSAGARVDLAWEHRDLFGLLYMLLANDPQAGGTFARVVRRSTSVALENVALAGLPAALKDSEQIQAKVFIELAGPYMGSSASKGRTYTWLHKHLADAYGRVSPRTFLEAVRHASMYRGGVETGLSIPPVGLRTGIQAASELRLRQLKEEYDWIDSVIEPLADQQVPCRAEDLFARWGEANTIASMTQTEGQFLEPIEFSEGDVQQPAAILKALLRIGVAERRADGRINIPDIYRVAAKMLRKGGIRPKR